MADKTKKKTLSAFDWILSIVFVVVAYFAAMAAAGMVVFSAGALVGMFKLGYDLIISFS